MRVLAAGPVPGIAVLFAAVAAVAAAAATAAAQANPDRVLVAAAMPSQPAAVVHELDPATGVHTTLGRFPSDSLAPLAIAVDPATREPLLALADAGGSRIVRLFVRGSQVLGERVLAQLPATATGMCVPSIGDVVVATDGANGGIWRVGRQGGGVVSFWTAPAISALSQPVILPGKFWAAQDLGAAGPTLAALLDTMPGAPAAPVVPLTALPGVRITGIHEFVGSRRTQLLADTQGVVHELSLPPIHGIAPVALQTPFVSGGAVAMHGGPGRDVWVLGGAADPTLKSFPQSSPQVVRPVTVLGGPFAGAPVDFAWTGEAIAAAVPFGSPCASPASGSVGAVGAPTLGNAGFALGLAQGLPNAPALLVLGTSDHRYGVLPLPAPIASCELLVAADATALTFTGGAGEATFGLPIPVLTQLAGAVFFAQWFQDPAGPRSSDALALLLF